MDEGNVAFGSQKKDKETNFFSSQKLRLLRPKFYFYVIISLKEIIL